MGVRKEKMKVYDMTCTSCESRIQKAIEKMPGVTKVMVSYEDESLMVEYEDTLCTLAQMKEEIVRLGYSVEKKGQSSRIIGFVGIALLILVLGKYSAGFDMSEKLNEATYLVLFIVGVFTSIHCVGMCGGIMISQSIAKEEEGQSKGKLAAMKPALLYNLGRVLSYTILGGVVGALGSVFALSLQTKAALQIFAGVFMVIMGFNMAGFSWFKKIHIRLPFAPCKVKRKGKAPFIVGMLNGFMPCGPLQTMQLYALGTGSAVKGALSMFLFALGTVPLMLTFGAISGLLSKGYTKKILKFSGMLVILLGIIMGNRGLALAGVRVPTMATLAQSLMGKASGELSPENIAKAELKDGFQEVKIAADGRGYSPNVVVVQKGIPVKWIVDGVQITSCNNAIVVPKLNIEKPLKRGENLIEFTPEETGDISFSCWMGMIPGVIKVVEDVNTVDAANLEGAVPPAGGSSCCGGGAATEQAPSIYGQELSKVPTERLIQKATLSGDLQKASIKGVGYEFEPIITVVQVNKNTQLTLDLEQFDTAENTFIIAHGQTGEEVQRFEGKRGQNEVAFLPKEKVPYLIMQGTRVLGILEVVEEVNSVDIEEVRARYFQ